MMKLSDIPVYGPGELPTCNDRTPHVSQAIVGHTGQALLNGLSNQEPSKRFTVYGYTPDHGSTSREFTMRSGAIGEMVNSALACRATLLTKIRIARKY